MDSKNIKVNVYLAQEVIEEILSRLPVESLLRFRRVSKSWLSLFTSKRFIEAHRQNSIKNKTFSRHKVIFQYEEGVFKQCSVQQLLDKPASIEPSLINSPTKNNQLMRGADVVGCCNGLLCLLTNHVCLSLYLWNPATMIFMELPNLKGLGYTKLGFGCDGTSGAYKVFVVSSKKGNVYSSKTNSWKPVLEHGCLSLYDTIGVFACGKIHWIIEKSEDDDYIESFDLGSEEFGRIELPYNPPTGTRPFYRLAEIGGQLNLVRVHVYDDHRQSNIVVWVMNEESGWLKLANFPGDLFHHRYVPVCPVFGGGPNGEILLMIHENFLVYRKDDGHVVRSVKNSITTFSQRLVYVESLVSPNFTTPS